MKNTLARIPCHFEMKTYFQKAPALRFRPGWVKTDAEFMSEIVSHMKPQKPIDETPIELLPEIRRQEREEEDRFWNDIRGEAKRCLRLKKWESDLPGELGRARLHLPIFMLQDGAALGFLRVRQTKKEYMLDPIGEGNSHIPTSSQSESWKGIRLQPYPRHLSSIESYSYNYYERPPVLVEIDWTSSAAGKLSVTRENLLNKQNSGEIRHWVSEWINAVLKNWLEENADSPYSLLNARVARYARPTKRGSNWISPKLQDGSGCATWKPLRFPCLNSLIFAYSDIPKRLILKWKGREIEVVRCLGQQRDDDHYDGLSWNSPELAPSRIVAIPKHYYHHFQLAPLWTGLPRVESNPCPAGMTSAFPPYWKTLIGVIFDDYSATNSPGWIWNPRSPLVASLNEDGWRWATDKFKGNVDPLPWRNEILAHSSRAAAWVICCLKKKEKDIWEGIKDRDPSFFDDLWHLLFPERKISEMSEPVILHWRESASNKYLRVLSPGGWKVFENIEDITAVRLRIDANS